MSALDVRKAELAARLRAHGLPEEQLGRWLPYWVEGRLRALRETVLDIGTIRFGPPPPAVRSKIESMTDEGELRRLLTRLYRIDPWNELLAG